MRKQQYITIEQAREMMAQLRQINTYKPITLIKKVVGYGMIVVGCATAWLPSGSIALIVGGCALVSIDYKKLLATMGLYGWRAYAWLYTRRSRKLRSYYRHLKRLR